MSNSSKIIDALVNAIGERPNDFTLDRFTLIDRKTNLQIWIASGLFHYGVYSPFRVKFNLLQKIRLHCYIEKLKAWKACSILAAK